MSYDPTDPDSVDAEQAFRAGREQYLIDAWAWMVRDARGRLILADLLLSTGYMGQTFVPGQPDVSAHLEGKRAIGLALHAKIGLNYAEFLPDIETQVRNLASDVGHSSSGDGKR